MKPETFRLFSVRSMVNRIPVIKTLVTILAFKRNASLQPEKIILDC